MAQELEMKVAVTPEEFARCLACLQAHTGTPGDSYAQVNYYFDTPAFSLAAAHSMLRVRSRKGKLFLQYKNKRKRTGALLLCDESEAELAEFPRQVNPRTRFPDAPDLDCTLRGELVTRRTDFVLPGAVVSFDESLYLGVTDFEIEIEGEAPAIERIAAFLAPRGESKKGNGKFSRFVRRYQSYYNLEKGE